MATSQVLYHMILLDLEMPISNGYEAAKNIQMLFDDQKVFKLDQSYSMSKLGNPNL